MPKSKSNIKILIVVVLLILTAAAVFLTWWRIGLSPRSIDSADKISFTIQAGEPLISVLERLEQEKIIRSALAARLYARFNRWDKKVQAGEYQLSPASDLKQILNDLQEGWQKQASITIPEGYRLEQIASMLSEKNLFSEEYDYAQVLPILRQEVGEGYFFPDTYFVDKNTTLAQLIVKVKDNSTTKTAGLFKEKNTSGLSEKEIYIMASLIEREAFSDNERSIIAGILLNRRQEGWPLQIDATIQYIVGCAYGKNEAECKNSDWWPKNLNKDDLAVRSSYNTYQNIDLPPAPICNPGLPSIEAVINPTLTDYYFYLHDGDGQIHYARTLDEHNQNVASFIK